jgi:hypothetical protein
MKYFVAYTWNGCTIFRRNATGPKNFTSIASYDDIKTADVVCRDLNRSVTHRAKKS